MGGGDRHVARPINPPLISVLIFGQKYSIVPNLTVVLITNCNYYSKFVVYRILGLPVHERGILNFPSNCPRSPVTNNIIASLAVL